MNNNKKNQYLEMFLNIADELLQEQKIKSQAFLQVGLYL